MEGDHRMSDDAISLPLTPAQILARLANLSTLDAQSALAQIASPPQTPGRQIVRATTIGQVQAAIGARRPTNPFAY
jgi:hypothetical protein